MRMRDGLVTAVIAIIGTCAGLQAARMIDARMDTWSPLPARVLSQPVSDFAFVRGVIQSVDIVNKTVDITVVDQYTYAQRLPIRVSFNDSTLIIGLDGSKQRASELNSLLKIEINTIINARVRRTGGILQAYSISLASRKL